MQTPLPANRVLCSNPRPVWGWSPLQGGQAVADFAQIPGISYQVAVLSGGASGEREVSLRSGRAVASALMERGHQVTCVDPAETPIETVDWSAIDAAFVALHGQFGEDGQVQQILEELRIPYTGSGVGASRLAFSKSSAKERFSTCGVPTPKATVIHHTDAPERLQNLAAGLGFPLVMKPDASGSSLGVTYVRSPEELREAASRCFAEGTFGLLERAIDGAEWTLGVVDEEPLPLVCIRSPRTFYDYTAKYADESTAYLFDTGLPPIVMQELEEVGLRACAALGTSGIARVDLMLDAAHLPWVLEVNTVPGFTDHSLVPKAAAARGWSLGELCEQAVRRSLHRFRSPYSQHNVQNLFRRPESAPLRTAG